MVWGSDAVVLHLDVLHDIQSGGLAGGVHPGIGPLALQRAKEALHDRVVPAVRSVVNSGHENPTQLFAFDKTGARRRPGRDSRVSSASSGGCKRSQCTPEYPVSPPAGSGSAGGRSARFSECPRSFQSGRCHNSRPGGSWRTAS